MCRYLLSFLLVDVSSSLVAGFGDHACETHVQEERCKKLVLAQLDIDYASVQQELSKTEDAIAQQPL